jgi:hypothetical protein
MVSTPRACARFIAALLLEVVFFWAIPTLTFPSAIAMDT